MQPIIRNILDARKEQSVIKILTDSYSEFGCTGARFYDANSMPLHDEIVFVLRRSAPASREYPVGKPIHESIANEQEKDPRIFFDRCTELSAGYSWVKDYQLEGKSCVDIPILCKNKYIGLWSMDSDKEELPEEEKIKIRLISDIVGLKINEIRNKRYERTYDQIRTPYQDILTKSKEELLEYFITRLCKRIAVKNLAYFEFDPVEGFLNKIVDVVHDKNGVRRVDRGGVDRSYLLGDKITGKAWREKKFRYIPDFNYTKNKLDIVIDKKAEKSHFEILDEPVKTLMYSKVDIPGARPGLLRAINRTDVSALQFTDYNYEIFKKLSIRLSEILTLRDASKRVERIWSAFRETLNSVRQDEDIYESIGKYLSEFGIKSTAVVIFKEDGSVIHSWSNNKAMAHSLSQLQGHVVDPSVFKLKGPKFIETKLLPTIAQKVFKEHGIHRSYIVPVRETISTSAMETLVATLIPTRMAKHLKVWDHEREKGFWGDRPHILQAFQIFGELAALARELSHNKLQLYYANEAIGTIGHELRAPAQTVVTLTEELSRRFHTLARSIPDPSQLSFRTVELGPNKRTYFRELTGIECLRHINDIKDQMNTYAKLFRRVIDDAVRWARLGGKNVEVFFESVSIEKTITSCIREVVLDLQEKPGLSLDVRPSISQLPKIVADDSLIHIMIFNLIDNAIKYSHDPSGNKLKNLNKYPYTVKIWAERQTGFLDLKIENWGFGIKESEYESIFSSFYRTKTRDRLHTVRGVGLGLPTCKKIALLHKGTIAVKSIPTLNNPERIRAMEGYRTTFTVRLPLNLPPGRHDIELEHLEL